MEINELEVKVENAAAKVEKIKGTIQKHEVQLAKKVAALTLKGIDANNLDAFKWSPEGSGSEHYWDICQVEQKQDDIKGANRKLRDAGIILENWKARLNIVIEKERFLSEQAPAVIIEFLNQWKEQARDWYIQAHARYVVLRAELDDAEKDAKARFFAENPKGRTWGTEWDKFMKGEKEINNIRGAIAMMGAAVATMSTYRKEEERLAWLERMLEDDRKAKLFDLINRINAVVGSITDAAGLYVSAKGNLDGIIVGENGKAKIETIGAGGYNIQCFHYRTLVHKL